MFSTVFPATFGVDQCQARMHGIAYDPATRRMYISYDWGNQPTVQVFQTAAASSDTTVLAAPTGDWWYNEKYQGCKDNFEAIYL